MKIEITKCTFFHDWETIETIQLREIIAEIETDVFGRARGTREGDSEPYIAAKMVCLECGVIKSNITKYRNKYLAKFQKEKKQADWRKNRLKDLGHVKK